MKKQEWNEGLDHLDPELVEEYVEQKDLLCKKKRWRAVWIRVGAIAACIIFIVSAIIVAPKLLKDRTDDLSPPINNPPIQIPPNQNPPNQNPPSDSAPGIYQTTFYFDNYQEMISAFGDASSGDTIPVSSA